MLTRDGPEPQWGQDSGPGPQRRARLNAQQVVQEGVGHGALV